MSDLKDQKVLLHYKEQRTTDLLQSFIDKTEKWAVKNKSDKTDIIVKILKKAKHRCKTLKIFKPRGHFITHQAEYQYVSRDEKGNESKTSLVYLRHNIDVCELFENQRKYDFLYDKPTVPYGYKHRTSEAVPLNVDYKTNSLKEFNEKIWPIIKGKKYQIYHLAIVMNNFAHILRWTI